MISLFDLAEKFPTEDAARDWFEAIIWPGGARCCPRCGSVNTHEARGAGTSSAGVTTRAVCPF
ncbi:transposase [Candidatus Palauibacter sp.]|uniref:transposase n=1 Tax=Candidatus Palauibacter sp. TaxID=3101350 RepID=UPI003D111564